MMIYCINCENACSEEAASCPKCGHPLQEKKTPSSASTQFYGEIGTLRIVGVTGIILGIPIATIGVLNGEANGFVLGTAFVVCGVFMRHNGKKALRIAGTAVITLGVLIAVIWVIDEGVGGFVLGISLLACGFLVRFLGGIWATLERIARR